MKFAICFFGISKSGEFKSKINTLKLKLIIDSQRFINESKKHFQNLKTSTSNSLNCNSFPANGIEQIPLLTYENKHKINVV